MGDEWQEATFSEAFSINPRVQLKRGRSYPFVDMAAVNPSSRYVLAAEERQFTGGGSRFSTGDTLMARITPCLENGKIAQFCGEPDQQAHGSTEFIVIRGVEGISDTPFAYYLAKWEQVRGYAISQMTGTSGRQRIPTSALTHLLVPLPPLPEQRAIAHILGTLDDKIELNRRMNETLEAMARALFKSWFVDFDPVRAKCSGEPACSPQSGHAPQSGQAHRPAPTKWPQHILDLFPDRFVDSELGEIPEGWEVGTLEDRSSLNPETWSKKTRPPTINYVDLSNTKWGRIEVVTKYPQEEAPSRAQRVLRPGDTIVGTVRPGNGSYAFVSEDGLTGSTGFAALRPTRAEFSEFVYLAATQRENIEALSHLADGGAYPAVRPDTVAATQIVGANADVLKQFSRYTGPLLVKAAQNRREARTLTSLRDTLLPELISGELRLQSANIGTEQWQWQWRRN